MGTVWEILMICVLYLLSGSRNRAWLKWKYRPQHPWLVPASPLASPQPPWPVQEPWVCSPPSTAQARPPHPPALLLQSDMGTPLCQPHRQVRLAGESGATMKCFNSHFPFWQSTVLIYGNKRIQPHSFIPAQINNHQPTSFLVCFCWHGMMAFLFAVATVVKY